MENETTLRWPIVWVIMCQKWLQSTNHVQVIIVDVVTCFYEKRCSTYYLNKYSVTSISHHNTVRHKFSWTLIFHVTFPNFPLFLFAILITCSCDSCHFDHLNFKIYYVTIIYVYYITCMLFSRFCRLTKF